MQAAPLIAHYTADELEQAYRAASRPIERSRWHILWLKARGKSIPEIMDVTGYGRTAISLLISRYNQHGPGAVRDKRQDNRSEPALNLDQQQQLAEALLHTLPNGGVWTSSKVQAYVQEHFSLHITDVCAWGYFKRLSSRPRHQRAATREQQDAPNNQAGRH